jgi:hypothetical protein
MGSNKFSKVGQLRTNFGPIFMNFGAIGNTYELNFNLQGLLINLELNKEINYFIFLF